VDPGLWETGRRDSGGDGKTGRREDGIAEETGRREGGEEYEKALFAYMAVYIAAIA
jgi:hypothetical protein